MSSRSEEWAAKRGDRAEEVARALVRVGVMTHAQVARLLGVPAAVERRVMRSYQEEFEEQRKVSSRVKRGRYRLPNRVTKLVRLTDDALAGWAEREGIRRVRNRVPVDVLGQTIRMGDVLIALRQAGVLYDEWDMMLPRNPEEALHAHMVRRNGESFELGVFLMPMTFSERDAGNRRHVFSGTVQQVMGAVERVSQSNTKRYTLFLAAREHYSAVLRVMTNVSKESGNQFYLLPLESFMEEPRWYLEAIATDDLAQRTSLLEDVLGGCEGFEVPAHHDYQALLKLDDWTYRFMDTWVGGSIKLARAWRRDTNAHQVSGEGRMARAHVYVYDETMRVALEKVMQHRPKPEGQAETPEEEDEESMPKRSAGSIVEVREWLDGMVMPQSMTDTRSSFVEPEPEPEPQPESEVHQDDLAVLADAKFDEEYAQFEARMADDSHWLEMQPSVPETSKPDVVRDDVPKPESTARSENRWSLLKMRPRR